MKQYKHTQIGYLMVIALGIAVLLIGNLVRITNFNPTAAFLLALMVLCLASFATMTVEVDAEAISLRLGIGVIRRRFLLKEVESHRTVKNPVYYGWGIHLIPNGWIFNVSGLQAVELQMKNGRKYRIGTDDVRGLTNAVETNMQKV